MVQHDEYSSIPQTVRDIVANRCSLLDRYILFQTGSYEYTALIHNPVTNEVRQLVFTRLNNYSQYMVTEVPGTWDFQIHNEYYCYSNVGLGSALDLPVMEGVQSHAAAIFTVVLLFLVVFRSALFPFRKKR